MKKVFSAIFIALFLAILILPLAFIGKSKDTASSENRVLSEFPKLNNDGKLNSSYFAEFDSWINEHIGFRAELIQLNASIMQGLFKVSSEDSVVLGKDGWLFYQEDVKDYINAATLTDRNVNNIAKTLKMMQEACQNNGKTFVFTVAPNKSTIYGQYMPDNYKVIKADGNLELLKKACDKEGINYVDLASVLTEKANNSKRNLYQLKDSHWTYEGALLAYNAIMEASGLEYDSFDYINFIESKDWHGDLEAMINPAALDNAWQVSPDYQFNYNVTSAEAGVEAINITSENPKGSKEVYAFRDSFFNTTHVFFAENFNKASFSRAIPYRLNRALSTNSQLIVLEIVERNIPNLADTAPMLTAPEISLELNDVSLMADSKKKPVYGQVSGSLLHVYGELDESLLGSDYDVTVMMDYGDYKAAYKAFPVYEKRLLGAKDSKDNGYSVYLPYQEGKPVKVSVLVESKGMCLADMDKEIIISQE